MKKKVINCSKNNYLSSLSIEGYELSPKFNKDTLEYSCKDLMIDKITINAEVEEPEITADWFEIANTKLTQADNLNINTTPIKNGVQIDTTSKNGETTTTEVINGKDGYTPVKGVDYFTETEVNQIVNDVLAKIPTSEGVGY